MALGRREVDIDEAGKSEDQKILDEAKGRFKRAQEWEGAFRKLYLEDVKFSNGDSDNGWQWPDNVKNDRDLNDKPCLTVNKVRTIVNKLANESKKNPPEPRIKPVGDKVSFDAAQVWEGLLRHIQYISNAQSTYGVAKESQLEGGIGYWHITHDHVDDLSFDQDIKLTPLETLQVYLDCDIRAKDGADAMWGFIFTDWDRKEFERANPNVSLPPARSPMLDDLDDWIRKDGVRVAEYYRINITEDTLYYVEDAKGESWTGLASELPPQSIWRKQIAEYKEGKTGGDFKERKVKHRQLQWFKIAGNEIIARDTERKGKYVPIIREVGRERKIEGNLYRSGLVRALKDQQRMYNYNCLHLDTPLPTPGGWTTMAAVQIGDTLISDTGIPTKVIGVSPVNINRKCYRLQFEDGTEIVADDGHLWTVEERGPRKASTFDWQTKTIKTAEIDPAKHLIRVVKPIDLEPADAPVHPYVMGAWLGDGVSAGGAIHSGFADADAMERNLRATGHKIGGGQRYKHAETVVFPVYGIRADLVRLGVLGNKHIPAAYLRGSREQRLQLLQGLMDTDGCATKAGQCVFVTVSDPIAAGMSELLRSLGIKVSVSVVAGALRKFPNGQTYQTQQSYRFSFTAPAGIEVFQLERKAKRINLRAPQWRRTGLHRIVSIVETDSVPVKCITVDAPSKLFLAGEGMIPTHNTSGEVEVVALQTKTPWILPAAAIEGNEAAWANANTTNAAYLTYRHADDSDDPIPKPERLAAPTPAQGFLDGMRIAAAELEMASGIAQGQQVNPGIERTPAAIKDRISSAEIINYDFMENEMLAMRHTAVVIMDLAPHIYDTQRIVKIRAKDGTISEITIDPDAEDAYRKETNEGDEKAIKVLFNPKIGKFAIEADVGPAYQTQRQAAWEAFLEIIKGSPELIAQIGDLGFLAADFPMAQEIADRLRRNIEQTAPWLLKDAQTGPLIQKLSEDLADAQKQLGEVMVKLTEERMKSRGKAQLRDIELQDSITKKLTAATNAVEDMQALGDTGPLKAFIMQTIREMGGFDISEIERANEGVIEGGGGTGGTMSEK